MTYQDEFARRNARGARTGEGGDPDKPLLFRGGDGGGGDASASLAQRQAARNHPVWQQLHPPDDAKSRQSPSFEKEGQK